MDIYPVHVNSPEWIYGFMLLGSTDAKVMFSFYDTQCPLKLCKNGARHYARLVLTFRLVPLSRNAHAITRA